MNDVLSPEVLPPQSAPASSRIEFADRRPDFRRLIMRGAFLELITVGFYRFWLATDMRRHLWSHTTVDGDAPEYTGSAKELLIGFLFALAILVPLYVVYFLIGLEAERLQAFASVPLAIFYYLFLQFAIYRARRYRLTRTIWRGVRFSMGGSGISYCWRVALWSLWAMVTLGIALPWRQAALERFKMRHTAYGSLAGRFDGTGGQLFRRGWGLWLLLMVLVFGPVSLALASLRVPSLAGIPTDTLAGVVAAICGVVLAIAFPFVQAIYKAIEWRWWVSGIRFGDVQFESDMSRGRLVGLYWKLIGWGVLILIGFMVWVSAVFGIGYLTIGEAGMSEQKMLLISQHIGVMIGMAVGYVAYILLFWALMRLYLIHDLWQRVAGSVTVHNLHLADDVAGQGEMVGALGEGMADSLDIGGL